MSSHPVGDPGALGDVLREVLNLAGAARPALARRLGLSVTETWAVEHVMEEPMGPVELARRLDMTSAASTVLVRRLEEAGHLTREPHPGDRRRTVLRPTPHAQAQVWAHLGPALADFDAAAAGLTDAEREVVVAYLRKVAVGLERLIAGEEQADA